MGLVTLRKKGPRCLGCRVRVNRLAPAIRLVDNVDEIKQVMERAYVPAEDWSIDEREGLVHIPGVGAAGDGDYIVADPKNRCVDIYRSRAAVYDRYEKEDGEWGDADTR